MNLPEKNCLMCVHVRHVRPDPTVLQEHAVCTESPPIPVAIPRGGAVGITGMFPPVGQGMWCSKFVQNDNQTPSESLVV